MIGPIVNNIKCIVCGKCVNICPKDVFSINDSKKLIVISDECMLCSHCYNICPSDAINFAGALKKPEFVSFNYREKVKTGKDFPAGDIVNIFRSRRSVRKFREDNLSDSQIRDIVEFASTAPSGSNCQEWSFTVINGRSQVWDLALDIKGFFLKINRLARNPLIRYLSFPFMGMTLINYYKNHYRTVEMAIEESAKGKDLLFHGAPAVIIIHGTMNGSTPVEDGSYAAYNICLLSHYMNIGTCLIGFAVEALNRSPEILKKLEIPAGDRVHAVIAAGYCDVTFLKQSLRKPYTVNYL